MISSWDIPSFMLDALLFETSSLRVARRVSKRCRVVNTSDKNKSRHSNFGKVTFLWQLTCFRAKTQMLVEEALGFLLSRAVFRKKNHPQFFGPKLNPRPDVQWSTCKHHAKVMKWSYLWEVKVCIRDSWATHTTKTRVISFIGEQWSSSVSCAIVNPF